jgi:predicted transcriptional regulator
VIEKMVEAAAAAGSADAAALHMSLANYAAGAIMMPYAPFLEAGGDHRYDIDRLCAQFGASVEQVATG